MSFTTNIQKAEATKPVLPGDDIRRADFMRGDELGMILIQVYDEHLRVASFLPGESVCHYGDTPKFEPEESEWCQKRELADACFDRYVAQALADGWVVRSRRFD